MTKDANTTRAIARRRPMDKHHVRAHRLGIDGISAGPYRYDNGLDESRPHGWVDRSAQSLPRQVTSPVLSGEYTSDNEQCQAAPCRGYSAGRRRKKQATNDMGAIYGSHALDDCIYMPEIVRDRVRARLVEYRAECHGGLDGIRPTSKASRDETLAWVGESSAWRRRKL